MGKTRSDLPSRVAWGRLLVGAFRDEPTEQALLQALEFAAADKVAAEIASTREGVEALLRDSARHRQALASWSTRPANQGGPAITTMETIGADCIEAAFDAELIPRDSLRTAAGDCVAALIGGWP